MRLPQKILCLIFLLSYTAETSVTCFALNLFIKTVGANRLGGYYAYSAILCILLVLFSIYLSRKISAINRFIGLHTILGVLATICIFTSSETLQAQAVFLAMIGINLIIYFCNWSIVSVFVTTFESKRLFPKISAFGQVGVFAGALFAMGSQVGINKIHYLGAWLIIKILLVLLGIFLRFQPFQEAGLSVEKTSYQTQEEGIIQILRHYKTGPQTYVVGFDLGNIVHFDFNNGRRHFR